MFAEFNESLGQMTHYSCEPAGIFIAQEYDLPDALKGIAALLKLKETVSLIKGCAIQSFFFANFFSYKQ